MRIAVTLVCLLALASCVPVSTKSIVRDDEQLFDPQLVGAWGEPDEQGTWVFDGANNYDGNGPDGKPQYRAYDVTYTEDGQASHLKGRLTKLDGETFLDLTPDRDLPGNAGGRFIELMLSQPLHTWVKVAVSDGKLQLTPVDLDWLNRTLKTDAGAIAHMEGQDKDWPIITAGTQKLRQFIERHMHDEGFFGQMGDLTHVPLPPAEPSPPGSTGTSYDNQYRQATQSHTGP